MRQRVIAKSTCGWLPTIFLYTILFQICYYSSDNSINDDDDDDNGDDGDDDDDGSDDGDNVWMMNTYDSYDDN